MATEGNGGAASLFGALLIATLLAAVFEIRPLLYVLGFALTAIVFAVFFFKSRG
jgi:hypothetical protein